MLHDVGKKSAHLRLFTVKSWLGICGGDQIKLRHILNNRIKV